MNLPIPFCTYTTQLMGDALFATLCEGLEDTPPVSIRMNPFKSKGAGACPTDTTPVAWCQEGVYMASRPNFTFDPLLHAGLYYVQEASSMFLAHVLRRLVHRPVVMLDLCAAPGGKSTLARSVLPEGSLLFANEPDKKRVQILRENLQKFGHPEVIVTNNLPHDYKKSGLVFDVVLADVPCSGEGMFRKDPDAIESWSAQHVTDCQRLQRQIITDIWPCIKPGGLLIYSTCTFNALENEENVDWIAHEFGASFVALDTDATWHITGALGYDHPVCRFIPGKSRGEGLFMAVLRKEGNENGIVPTPFEGTLPTVVKTHKKVGKDRKGAKEGARSMAQVATWLQHTGQYVFHELQEKVIAMPCTGDAHYLKAVQTLRVVHAGIELATRKGNDLIPQTSLALSIDLRQEAFPHMDLDYQQAMAYLRKEALTLPASLPRGWVLLTYKGIPLGFAKQIGNRANNLYPQEWRIKSTHLPSEEPNIIQLCNNI